MENNKKTTTNELKQQIGIDKSILYSFEIRDIDIQKLEEVAKRKNKRQYVNLVYDNHSSIRLENGKRIGKLEIKDAEIGKMIVQFRKNNLTGEHFSFCNLHLLVSSDGNNLQNLNSGEYYKRVEEVFEILKEQYGIESVYDSIKIKSIEINVNIELDEPFERYRQPILLMIKNVPNKIYGSRNEKNKVKYATWNQSDRNAQMDTLETVSVKNRNGELKIYNKTKNLMDTNRSEGEEKDILRVEYTIKNKQTIERVFESNQVAFLTDRKVKRLFLKYFNRDIVRPYDDWKKKNRKDLVEMVKKHRELNQKWTSYFLADCSRWEDQHNYPMLFDPNDMLEVFKRLDVENGKKNNKNYYNKYKKFKKQVQYWDNRIGNSKRIDEIIMKILSL